MRGVAARYPAFDAGLAAADRSARPHQPLPRRASARRAPFGDESAEQLSIESFVALQSRGLPIAPPVDARLNASRERGARLFAQRMGQLDLSCAQCHDDHAGQSLGGSTIPQAHPTGYPLYRLEWQAMGSLQRRLRSCIAGVRAEPFAYGAPELIELELYLDQRASGMTVDTPALRP